MRYQIRELGVGGILDQAIQIMKNHFGMLLGIVMLVLVPVLLPMMLLGFYIESAPPDDFGGGEVLIPFLGTILLLMLVMPISNMAVMVAVSRHYLGEPVTIGQAIGQALRRLPALIWTNIFKGIAIFGGFVLFIIPGILLMFMFFLTDMVVVFEKQSGIEALKRSRQLMKQHWGNAFVIAFLLFVISVMLSVVTELLPSQLMTGTVDILVQCVLAILQGAALVVFYFSTRCKHEQFDLQRLAEMIHAEAVPADEVEPAVHADMWK